MDALAKLTDLYQQRDNITKQIEAIGELLGLKQQPKEKKERQKRGPNKPKTEPPKLVPPKLSPPGL